MNAKRMLNFGLFMSVFNLLISIYFTIVADKFHSYLFMGATFFWIMGVLIWQKNVNDDG
jgi:hypothetical protein